MVQTTASPRPKRGEKPLDGPIYDSIYRAVMTQRLKPGTRLPEARLCELFGVSRTLVRRALQRLAHEHVVELRPNKGAVVASPTPEETRDVFTARRAVEGAIVPLATAQASVTDIARLRTMLATEHDALHRGEHAEWAQSAGAFHLALAELSGNRVLAGFLSELMTRCSLIVALYQAPGDSQCEHEEHARLVDLIAAGQGAEAAALMDTHLLALEKRIRFAPDTAEPDLGDMLGI
ncbi:GntR family transcriptional regulator [Niveibacterium sp. SC-1]|uniref:GntR family transcriptional regulator n=1 Tax=Niveibacterium sp. SC-1 TaxID=3135646 RepID=UPI00311E8C8C